MTEDRGNIWAKQSEPTVKKHSSAAVKRPTVKIGLGVAALVFGVVAAAFSIALTGIVFGVIGVVLGILCITGKSEGKAMAGWGIGLSLAGILASCLFGLLYYGAYLANEKEASEDFEDSEGESKQLEDWEGEIAPDFSVVDVEGGEVKLYDYEDQPIVLCFWEPSCLRCRDAVELFIELRKTFPEEELKIIGISNTESAEVRAVGRKLGINYSLAVNKDQLPEPYCELGWWSPNTFFISRDGIIKNVLKEYHEFDKLNKLAKSLVMAENIADEPNAAVK